MGSSPRVWGQAVVLHSLHLVCGIIPTRVGTRRVFPAKQTTRRDHPHACGDKQTAKLFCRLRAGSSPRVWGQAASVVNNLAVTGIIPTRVGTSLFLYLSWISCWDHPHACGDKDYNSALTYPATGSSPRVWGQVRILQQITLGDRIIPTRVGTSILSAQIRQAAADHPHACGDKQQVQQLLN